MIPERMWPGMFQAKANGAARKRDDYEACESDLCQGIASQLDAAASYAISDEQGARKKVLDNRQ